MPSDNTTFLIVLGSIIVLSLFYVFNGEPIHNEGNLQLKNKKPEEDVSDSESDAGSQDSSQVMTEDDSIDSSIEIIKERAMGQNGPYYRRRNGGVYKHNSYRSVGADRSLKNIDQQFDVEDITKNYTDRYQPLDESNGQGAPISIKNNKGTEKDKYDVNSYLPQEKEKDWFETIENVDVKNTHLINIYRPIGANTIGSTHKNATYDLRGTDKAICPKFVTSPWLQSSIEPDRSSKSLCA